MAKPSTPSRAPRNAPQFKKDHRYIDALVRDDFGRMSRLTTATAHAWAKKKLDAASQTLQVRNERNEKKARLAEAREYRRAEAGLQAELRESDHRARLLSRLVRTKVKPDGILRHKPPRARKRPWPFASVALPKYDGPIIDRRGERGVFARFRYYSSRTAREGVSQRVLAYCFHGAELDAAGKPYSQSNVGDTIDEALCAFDHLEQINWSAQAGAKLLMHGILAMDHRQTPDEMMAVGMRWAEATLGRFDLPYLVTLHAPPPDGDQRNWHCHVLWSFRPMERVGHHEWIVGEMLRTDLDNPQAMKLMREMFAAVMTDASFEAGQNQVWTARSNADRGLPHEPQVHLDAAKTNRARSGEYVADNEENHQRVLRSKAAVIDDDLRHLDERLAEDQVVQRAITRHWARLPAAPMRLPQPAIAATLAAALPPVSRGLPLARAVVIPSPLPERTAVPATIAGPIPPLAVHPLPLVDLDAVAIGVTRHLPSEPSVVARIDFANLRKPLATVELPAKPARLPVAQSRAGAVTPLVPLPAIRRTVEVLELPRLPVPIRASATRVDVLAAAPVIPERADIPASPRPLPGAPAQPPRLAPIASLPPPMETLQLDPVYAARRRLADRLRAADDRRKREDAEAAAKAAEAAMLDTTTIERQRRITDACRILLRSSRRPYRIVGNRLTLDLDVMGRRERDAVAAFGLGEPELVAALQLRARLDRDEDRRKTDGRSTEASPLDGLTVLGRVADQRDASTSDWAASQRYDDPSASPIGQAIDATPDPARAATRAEAAARLRDNQRG